MGRYTINDVQGYLGILPSKQKSIRESLNITLNKARINGHLKSFYTTAQLELLMAELGYVKIGKNHWAREEVKL